MFDKMDREMDDILHIYNTLGGEKFDVNFRNTRKDIRTLCIEFKEDYQKVTSNQMERDQKSDAQKNSMEYKSLDFRIKNGIVRMSLNLVDIEKEITRYCKENDIHNEKFYNKYEAQARKEARGENASDESHSFNTNSGEDGFELSQDMQDIYDNMSESSVAAESDDGGSERASKNSNSMNRRKNSGNDKIAQKPKVNKDLLNEDEKIVQEMVESTENFEACVGVLIKREIFYQINNSNLYDEWAAKMPERFKRKIKLYRDVLQQEMIVEVDEEDETDSEDMDNIKENKDGMKLQLSMEVQVKPQKTLQLTADEEMALDMFDELDRQMDDNLKLVSKELDLLAEKLDVAEEELDKNAEMINQIDAGTKNLLEDVRDQNKMMKETLNHMRQPNKLICDIILIVVLCVFIGIFVFLLKRYFEIKEIIEEVKRNNAKVISSKRLLII